MFEQFRADLTREDLTIDELVAAAEKHLALLVPHQTRYKVQAKPDIRTIRYYTSRGLLPKPLSQKGGRARYGAAHLLRLILIKKLQAEHLPLKRVGQELEGLSEHQIVERILPGSAVMLLPQGSPKKTEETNRGLAFETLKVVHPCEGVAVHISPQTLASEASRKRLADALEQLAARVRALDTSQ